MDRYNAWTCECKLKVTIPVTGGVPGTNAWGPKIWVGISSAMHDLKKYRNFRPWLTPLVP